MSAASIRVALPYHLRNLAGVGDEVTLEVRGEVGGEVSLAAVLAALEAAYPVLCGTIRDHGGGKRRAFIRFFACGEDLSHEAPEVLLPAAVTRGEEPLLVVGAMAGG